MIAGLAFAMGLMVQSATAAEIAEPADEEAFRMIVAMKRAVFTAGVCERFVRSGGNLDEALSFIFEPTGEPLVDAAADEFRAELARGRQDPRRETVTAQQCQRDMARRLAELRIAVASR